MRTYGQFCPIARGSEILAERWTPIILRNLLPDRRVVVRFEFTRQGRRVRRWLLAEDREVELCRFDPGFGDDLVVAIDDPLAFARWHMGRTGWEAALRAGGITVTGPRALRQALPTWNAGPVENAKLRAEHGLPAGDLA